MKTSRAMTALRLALTLGVMGFIGHQLWRDGPAALASLRWAPGWMALSATSSAAALAGLALLSALGARRWSGRGLALGPWMTCWLRAYLCRYVPGKLLLLASRVESGRAFGLSPMSAAALVFWESLLLLAGAALATALCLLGLRLPPALAHLQGWLVLGLLLPLALALALPDLLRALWLASPRLAARFGPLPQIPRLPQLGLVVGYAGVWLLLGLSFAALTPAIEGAEGLPWAPLLGAYVLAYAGGQLLGLTPAGLGLREALLVGTLGPWTAGGPALAAALVCRLVQTLVELLLVAGASALAPPPARAD
jgi:hypothetical protein